MASSALESQRMAKAADLKASGVRLLKESEYRKASKAFQLAIMHVKGFVDSSNDYLHLSDGHQNVISESLAGEVALLHIACLSNLVLCHIKRCKQEKALEKCEEGLRLLEKKQKFLPREELDKFQAKLMARSVSCLEQLKRFGKGVRVLNEAVRKFPKDPYVRAVYKSFQASRKAWLKEENAKQKQEFKNLF